MTSGTDTDQLLRFLSYGCNIWVVHNTWRFEENAYRYTFQHGELEKVFKFDFRVWRRQGEQGIGQQRHQEYGNPKFKQMSETEGQQASNPSIIALPKKSVKGTQ